MPSKIDVQKKLILIAQRQAKKGNGIRKPRKSTVTFSPHVKDNKNIKKGIQKPGLTKKEMQKITNKHQMNRVIRLQAHYFFQKVHQGKWLLDNNFIAHPIYKLTSEERKELDLPVLNTLRNQDQPYWFQFFCNASLGINDQAIADNAKRYQDKLLEQKNEFLCIIEKQQQ